MNKISITLITKIRKKKYGGTIEIPDDEKFEDNIKDQGYQLIDAIARTIRKNYYDSEGEIL